jgi:hypothetical protein
MLAVISYSECYWLLLQMLYKFSSNRVFSITLAYIGWFSIAFHNSEDILYDRRGAEIADTHWSGNVFILRYILFKFIRSTCWDIPGWKFLGQYGTCLWWWWSNQLRSVMLSDAGRILNDEKGRKYVWSEVMCTSVWIRKWNRVVPCNELHQTRNVQMCILSLVKQNGCTLKRSRTAGHSVNTLNTVVS